MLPTKIERTREENIYHVEDLLKKLRLPRQGYKT